MPELPEIETIKIQLAPILKDQTVEDIEILNSKTFQGDKSLVIRRKIADVRRFAKIFVIDFENKISLAIHLKMSGRLIYRGKEQPRNIKIEDKELEKLPNPHTRVVFHFKSGDTLYFTDQRMFGWIKVMDEAGIKSQESRLGIEPFTKDFTFENFHKIITKMNRPIKVVLMDQALIAGIGNIYANDGLFCARINPANKAKSLSKLQIEKLYHCLIKVLNNGIKYKGASENLFRDAFGQRGSLQEHFLVYAKRGEKCLNNCGEVIKKIKLGGRGTFFCPNCQK